MTLVQRLRAKVNSTMVPIHLGNGQIINGSGLGSDSASPRLRNEAADKIVEQAARIEALSAVIRDIRSEDIEWFKKNGNYSITLTLRQKMAALINAQDTQG